MDLPLLPALFAAFSLSSRCMCCWTALIWVSGRSFHWEPHEASLNHMVDSIAPTWDGERTTIGMTGVTMFAGFPLAYSILMPAFHIPLIVMLLALGLRGVSFEFRPQAQRYTSSGMPSSVSGSIVAACMQGVILGGLIQGVTIRTARNAFGGSIF